MQKKNFSRLFGFGLILVSSGILLVLIQNQNAIIAEMQKDIATLQLVQARQARMRPTIINRPVMPLPTNSNKDRLFKFLYSINGSGSSKNAATLKKIRYLPGELVVEDLKVAQSDPFFDLLGFLLDEDALKKIELPAYSHLTQAERLIVRAIKTELLQFGVSSEGVSNSGDGKMRIKINDFKY